MKARDAERTLTREKLEKLYYNDRLSVEDIGKKYNFTWRQVRKLFQKYGITLRGRGEANLVAQKRGKFG